ncbi:MAG TPA: LysR family transcriptional regulator [Parvibaculum sp.]|uniref:LysR family transcriptional regulator n=1 Tax=Parvibaculum sp. TaxID=2024848 RepID=UPI002C9C5E3A|nr:LysR family transcriptional regulator [Parvibaculum sp.]HMM14168.1 LysR family transcriptional regulator [Parvibaculum sp.]
MTLDQLRIFIAVAEREHVTRAARALGLTQSAVSSAIAALEARHDTRLFDRVGRHIELTAAGRLFLDEARGVLARAHAAELMLSELGSLGRGTLNVHASQTIASYWLPAQLVRFREAYPRIEVRLAAANTETVARAVLEGSADLGFVEGAVKIPALASVEVGADRLVLVVGAAHPLARRKRVSLAELAGAAWVVREAGSGTRSEVEAALTAMKLPVHAREIALELPSNEAVRAAVEAGAGVAGLSDLVAAPGLEAGTLRRLDVDMPARPFLALRHRERRLSKAAEALLACCGRPAGSGRARS